MARHEHFFRRRIGFEQILLCALTWLGMDLFAERALAATANDPFVKIDTSVGTFYVDLFNNLDTSLFPSDSPNTVQNFLNYVSGNSYQNTIVHQVSDPPADGLSVVRGGAFKTNFTSITTSSPINLEYHRLNTKGTIAMFKDNAQSGTATATSQWFINYDDNSTVFDERNNGGLAVFGQLVGNGMTVVNSIAGLTKDDFRPQRFDMPAATRQNFFAVPVLNNYTGADYSASRTPTASQLVVVNNVSLVNDHPAWQNPLALVAGSQQFQFDVNNDGAISALDVLTVVNFLNGHTHAQYDLSQWVFQEGLTGSATVGDAYLDVNGSGKVEALDVLQIVNYLNSQPAQSAALVAPMHLAMASVVVPEPGTLSLTVVGLLPLAAWAVRRRLRRR